MNHKIFNRILLVLFILFLVLYFSSNAGIIDYSSKNRKELTEKEIMKFEEDIKNGKSIDINNYNKNNNRYSNGLSKVVLKVSTNISGIAKDLVSNLFNQMEKSMDNYNE